MAVLIHQSGRTSSVEPFSKLRVFKPLFLEFALNNEQANFNPRL